MQQLPWIRSLLPDHHIYIFQQSPPYRTGSKVSMTEPIHILYMEDDPGLARLFKKRMVRM